MSVSDSLPGRTALRNRPVTLAAVAVALLGLPVANEVVPDAGTVAPPLRWLVLLAPSWVLAGGIVLFVVAGEDRPLASIGIERPTGREIGLGLLAFVVGVATFVVTEPLLAELGLSTTAGGRGMLAALPLWVTVALSLTAGVTEEVLFRGYPIERLAELTGGLWIGAAITVVAFTAAHVPFWGLGGSLQIGVWTIVVTALYVRTRNLPACVLMHVCNDLFAFVLLPRLIDAGALAS